MATIPELDANPSARPAAAPPGRNIVICIDGTANEFKLRQNTNVVKLFSLLVRDPERQIAYYHPGVGTMAPPGALTRAAKAVTRLLGMALGYGLFDDIREAYCYLMNNYQAGDRIYIFGFSRGAYTARALAALIHVYGLMGPGNDAQVRYAIRMIRSANKIQPDTEHNFFASAAGFKDTFSMPDCPIRFVGVWDTVSSVGWIENPVHLPATANNPSVEASRHAISIDERRAFFRTNLWRPRPTPPSGPADLAQVWFPGDHCDVGGGHAETESGLSQGALKWMVREAEAAGLLVDPAKRDALFKSSPPDSRAPAHESLVWYWKPLEYVPKRHWNWAKSEWERRANHGRRRTIPPGSLIHRSVEDRGPDYYQSRLPDTYRFVD
jgi:uncharacterized protein (DUF2235 family)